MFIGEMGKAQDSATLRNLLGNPRDLFYAKSSKISNHAPTESRRKEFIYVYDTVPLDASNPIDPLECEECNLESEYFTELALSVTFKL